jgi:hypothetical protein
MPRSSNRYPTPEVMSASMTNITRLKSGATILSDQFVFA